MYITIDGGTTNTRVSLVDGGRLIETVKLGIGAGKSMGDNSELKAGIKAAIDALIKDHGVTKGGITRILASGMITSGYGLCELTHIPVPAGIRELHDTMYETVIDDISDVPFVFIRGVKTAGERLETADMMRGEETELMGLPDTCGGEGVYILPGSHSKLIVTDNDGRIVDFKTMLSGEMAAALSQNTILKDSVKLSGDTFDGDYLMQGYRYAETCGLNEALFKVRILDKSLHASETACYSFFMGIVLCDEIKAILRLPQKRVIIGGKHQLKVMMAKILGEVSKKEVVVLDDDTVDSSTALGMIKIYESR